jgi:hypothetical protein
MIPDIQRAGEAVKAASAVVRSQLAAARLGRLDRDRLTRALCCLDMALTCIREAWAQTASYRTLMERAAAAAQQKGGNDDAKGQK